MAAQTSGVCVRFCGTSAFSLLRQAERSRLQVGCQRFIFEYQWLFVESVILCIGGYFSFHQKQVVNICFFSFLCLYNSLPSHFEYCCKYERSSKLNVSVTVAIFLFYFSPIDSSTLSFLLFVCECMFVQRGETHRHCTGWLFSWFIIIKHCNDSFISLVMTFVSRRFMLLSVYLTNVCSAFCLQEGNIQGPEGKKLLRFT